MSVCNGNCLKDEILSGTLPVTVDFVHFKAF